MSEQWKVGELSVTGGMASHYVSIPEYSDHAIAVHVWSRNTEEFKNAPVPWYDPKDIEEAAKRAALIAAAPQMREFIKKVAAMHIDANPAKYINEALDILTSLSKYHQ